MTDVTIASVLGEIERYKFNPLMIKKTALETLRAVTNGEIDLVDPSNPFIFCLENTATNTAAFMQQNEASTRRLYSSVSLTDEDLYLHMSDKDYIGRFAVPTTAEFTIMFSKEELISKLIYDPLEDTSKITIPKNTVFTIANTNFSLQYPIDIRMMSHGGLNIVYDVKDVSPLLALQTNVINWDQLEGSNGITYVRFKVEATQFNIITSYNDVSAASGFKTDIDINDQFYYARCYIQNSAGFYNEILTTHTQQIYDPTIPTAVITVLGTKVKVVIPVIYVTSGLVKGKLRIDIYQTKGEQNMLLGNYTLEDFSANWYNIDKKLDTVYTTPIRNFKTIAVFSTTHVTGGRNALSFDELRLRVIKNATGDHNLPVTNIQLQTTLEDNGFDVIRNVDTITNRIYLATRSLPKPIDTRIVTSASAGMSSMSFTLNDIVGCYGVIDNNDSVTLTSKTIYQNVNGITKPITELAYNQLNSMGVAIKCNVVTNGNYLFSPFHYVLDTTSNTFEVRAYYLDGPIIDSKNFIEENITTGIQVSIDSNYIIEKSDTGYILTISTKSSDSYKELDDSIVFAQLAFTYKNDTDKSYLLGELIGTNADTKERVFQFTMSSNFNVDMYDYISMNSFEYKSSEMIVRASLFQEMSIYFSTTKHMPITYVPSNIDDELGKFQLPPDVTGITHEKIRVQFGYPLKNLWAMSRSAVNTIPYQKYEIDVPDTYDKDIYGADPLTGATFSVDAQNNLIYNILHHEGDVKLDPNGNTIYKHRINEVMYDVYNQPIPVEGYVGELLRNVDILTIEGSYYFATDKVVIDYNKTVVSALLKWITVDLVKYNLTLLEKTKIYFYPKVTLGDIKVLVLNGIETTLPASQSFKVKLHVSSLTYNDSILTSALNKLTVKVIDDALKNTVISVSAIERALVEAYGNDVINVELTGLGGSAEYKAVTILNNSSRFSIRKRLTALPDNSLIVEEDVTVQYIEHRIAI